MIPLLLIVVLQAALLYGVLLAGGVFSNLEKNALDLLQEQSNNSVQHLQSNMTVRWTNLTSTEASLNATAQQILSERNRSWSDLERDSQLCSDIAEAAVPELIYRLRSNATTGIFLIFNDCRTGEDDSRTGVYIRTASPSYETAGNSDLEFLRGLPSVARNTDLSLSSFWSARFTFSGDADAVENRYFTRPLEQGLTQTLKESKYGCYWSSPFQVAGPDDLSAITYSIPLINDSGYVYGVLGVELSTRYVTSLLMDELNGDNTDFFLVLGGYEEDSECFQPYLTAGSRYKQFFSSSDSFLSVEECANYPGFSEISSDSSQGKSIHGLLCELPIYPSNSPFSDEHWGLLVAEDDGSLFSASGHFSHLVMVSVLLALALGIALSLWAGISIVRPITALARRLRSEDPEQRTNLPPSGIRELDSLSDAISSMTGEIIRSAQRTSRLIELSGLPVGVYELRTDPPLVYCSDGFFTLAGRRDLCGTQSTLTAARLTELLAALTAHPVEPDIYRVDCPNEEVRYVRVVEQAERNDTIGSVLDVTAEILERKRIEYERDYDPLTGICNRRAFETHMDQLFSEHTNRLNTGAMIMFDLDNLKFLNDTYGHDCGDAYIRAFADALRVFDRCPNLTARRSGDEFYVFLYGFQSKEAAMELIRSCWAQMEQTTLTLPDSTSFRIRVSGGISWYPQDAELPSRLIHYADFAMYWVKHTQKGSLGQFDLESYNASSYLVNGQDALNRLIDDELVHFAFQPIVSARTAETIGYELLMRSDVPEFRSPDVILRMAKSQGKLHHIEAITWSKGLREAKAMREAGHLSPNDMIFLNSIANQTLFPTEQQRIAADYAELLPQLVMEVTESEDNNMEFTRRKLDFVHSYGGRVAIDDFGTGYNSELALMAIPAQVVKIDISFVRDVDKDADKQLLIRNLIRFARKRGIEVLAEGVETHTEMCTLLEFGVDYMQGYYFARPLDTPHKVDGACRQTLLDAIRNTAPPQDT